MPTWLKQKSLPIGLITFFLGLLITLLSVIHSKDIKEVEANTKSIKEVSKTANEN